MALDTRDKRASAVMPGLPWRGLLPLPDGGLDQGDRQQVAFVYRGIVAQELVVLLRGLLVTMYRQNPLVEMRRH